MNRNKLIFKFAKNCEKPTTAFYRFMNIFFVSAMVLYGRKIYGSLRKKYGNRKFILVPTSDAGDIMYFRYSKKMLDEKYGKDWLYIYDNRNKRIVDLMGFENVCPMPVYSVAALSYSLFHDNDNKIDMINGYAWCMFDCEKANKNVRFDYPVMNVNQEYIDSIKKDNDLQDKKAIILAPYEQGITSSGFSILSMAFWEKLAKEFADLGYVVFTNCKNDAVEPVIKGTKHIFPRFSDMEACVSELGNMVSIRSGFVDYVRNSTAKMVVLYPNDLYINQWSIDLYNKRKNVREYKYAEGENAIVSEDELVKTIIAFYNEK